MRSLVGYSTGVSRTTTDYSNTQVKHDPPKKELDKNDFLRLLITELRNQDVLSAGDNKEFMQQLAQFASMEQMQNVASGLEKLASVQTMVHGASLLGKTVEGSAMDDPSQIVCGEVTEVLFSGGEVLLTVDGVKMKLTDVSSMKTQPANA